VDGEWERVGLFGETGGATGREIGVGYGSALKEGGGRKGGDG